MAESIPVFGISSRFNKLWSHHFGVFKPPSGGGNIPERIGAEHGNPVQPFQLPLLRFAPRPFLSRAFTGNRMLVQPVFAVVFWKIGFLGCAALAAVFQPVIQVDVIIRCGVQGMPPYPN